VPAVEKRTVSLPPAQASYIDSVVETGAYASASEVVCAGLRAAGAGCRDRTLAARGGRSGL
jgi:putative addiction module CopG family antidote